MKVVAGIATFNRRSSLLATIKSLSSQTDKIFVYDNDKESVDRADNGKFWGLTQVTEPCYYFCCDDDLIYPADYVEKTIIAIEKYNSIVTYHGRLLDSEGTPYYRNHRIFRCLGKETETREIDVCGSGVTAFRTDYFNPFQLFEASDLRMADLVFSLEAAKWGKKITHLAHKSGWIKYVKQPKGSTIAEIEGRKGSRQAEIADQIFRIRRRK